MVGQIKFCMQPSKFTFIPPHHHPNTLSLARLCLPEIPQPPPNSTAQWRQTVSAHEPLGDASLSNRCLGCAVLSCVLPFSSSPQFGVVASFSSWLLKPFSFFCGGLNENAPPHSTPHPHPPAPPPASVTFLQLPLPITAWFWFEGGWQEEGFSP